MRGGFYEHGGSSATTAEHRKLYPLPTADPARQRHTRLPYLRQVATLVRDVPSDSAGLSVMAKHKPVDPNGRHIRVYVTLLYSDAYRCLGTTSRALFIDMRAAVNATNN